MKPTWIILRIANATITVHYETSDDHATYGHTETLHPEGPMILALSAEHCTIKRIGYTCVTDDMQPRLYGAVGILHPDQTFEPLTGHNGTWTPPTT